MGETKIQLSFKCSKKWNKMKATKDGRFCGHCQQNVRDFTSISLEKLHVEKSTSCGRYSLLQIKNPYNDWRDKYVAQYQHARLTKRRFSINLFVIFPLIACISLFSRCIMGARTNPESIKAYDSNAPESDTIKPNKIIEEEKK